jgi:hypothetical protein
MEKKIAVSAAIMACVQSVLAYNPDLLNPSDKFTPADFAPRWIDAFILTMKGNISLLGQNIPGYLIILLLVGLLVAAKLIWGER